MLEKIQIVLVNPSHPGNIGSVARAMKVMDINRLVLVNPKTLPDESSYRLASGAADVLDNAKVFSNFQEAILASQFIVGTTARERDVMIKPVLPQAAIQSIKKSAETADVSQISLVFGAERTGLTNEEIRQCNILVNIPTGLSYRSLNLAQAVQIMAYECQKHLANFNPEINDNDQDEVLASFESCEGLLHHFEKVMQNVGFLNVNSPKRLMNRLWRLFNRAKLEEKEVNILRGFLKQVEVEMAKGERND